MLNADLYPIIVAVSVLTTFTTPYFIRLGEPLYNFIERHLPQRLHYLIDRYSTGASTESETAVLWRTVLKRYIWRIMLYSAVLGSVVMISLRWVRPLFDQMFGGWGTVVCAAVTPCGDGPVSAGALLSCIETHRTQPSGGSQCAL